MHTQNVTRSLVLGVFAALFVPAQAVAQDSSAQDKIRFGERGDLSFSDDMQFSCGATAGGSLSPTPCAHPSIEGQSTSVPGGGTSSGFGFVFAPAADYFVLPRLSVGGQILYAHVSGTAPSPVGGGTVSVSGDVWGFSPRVGYDLNFGNRVSFWPKVYVEYSNSSMSTGGPSVNSNRLALGLYAPVLFHPVPHFYAGVGPNLATDLSSGVSIGGQSGDGPKTTQYGVLVTLGGWFATGGGDR
jgi:hypothetical protein